MDIHRINLTVPDDIYEKLQEWKDYSFHTRDATACLALISMALHQFLRDG